MSSPQPSLTSFPSFRPHSTTSSPATTKPAVSILSLDHLVLTVRSINESKKWYSEILGMKPEAFVSAATPDVTRHSLKFGEMKINLHEVGKEFEPKATLAKPGTADLCFISSTSVETVRDALIASDVEMVDLSPEPTDNGIVSRTGARGKIRSVYCRDPDGNLIESVISKF